MKLKDLLSVVIIFGLPIIFFFVLAFPSGACAKTLEDAKVCTPMPGEDSPTPTISITPTPTIELEPGLTLIATGSAELSPTPTCTPTSIAGQSATPTPTQSPVVETKQQPTPTAGEAPRNYVGPTLIPLKGGSPK